MKKKILISVSVLAIISCIYLGGRQANSKTEIKEPKETIVTNDKHTINPKDLKNKTDLASNKNENKKEKKKEPPKNVEPLWEPEVINLGNDITSDTYILKNIGTGQVLGAKDENKIVPIASLTKIMTAYILLDKFKDMNDTVTMDPNLIYRLQEEGASMAGFLPNETVTVQDLLYGVILPSGADASILTANYISGDEEKFALLMNDYAKKLGMKNTQFKNSTGLDQEGHYSTVNDLSILLNEALKNKDFYEVFTTFEYQGEPCPLNAEGYYLKSTVANYDLTLDNGAIIGGKTGFTDDAGLCLASISEMNGQKYMFISTGADPLSTVGPLHTMDAQVAYNDVNRDSHYRN